MSSPSILIYHPVFAKFCSLVSSDLTVRGETLRQTSLFICASHKYYPSEEERIVTLRTHLENLLHNTVLTKKAFTILGQEKVMSEDAIFADIPDYPLLEDKPVCVFVEVKNEVGTGECDPALQCQSDSVKVYSLQRVSVLKFVSH
jgi:hypothetical protein